MAPVRSGWRGSSASSIPQPASSRTGLSRSNVAPPTPPRGGRLGGRDGEGNAGEADRRRKRPNHNDGSQYGGAGPDTGEQIQCQQRGREAPSAKGKATKRNEQKRQ